MYNKVFRRNQNKETIDDLLKLSYLYDQYISTYSPSEVAANVAKNGKYAVLSIILFLIKHMRGKINLNLDAKSPEWVLEVTADDIEGSLFKPDCPDEFEKILESIFNQIIRTLAILFESRQGLESSVTNFFKTDKKYHQVILDEIKLRCLLDEYEYDKLKEKLSLIFH